MAKGRAGWWWIDRWRKSTAYTDMTAEQRGCYRELLDELWLRDGVIPNEERILARIVGDPEAWAKHRDVVMARFVLTPEGWRNETHDEVSAGTSRAQESQREKGRRRAEKATRGEGGAFLRPEKRTTPHQPEHQPLDQPDSQPATSRSTSRSTSLPDPSPDPLPFPEPEPKPASQPAREEDPPTPATPAEARVLALSVLGPPPERGTPVDLDAEGRRILERDDRGAVVVAKAIEDPDGAAGFRARVGAALAELVSRDPAGQDGQQWLGQASRTRGGQVMRDYRSCTSVDWLRVTAERLEGYLVDMDTQAAGGMVLPDAGARASPKALQREAGMAAMIRGGMTGPEGGA